jgi:hypothetical protein
MNISLDELAEDLDCSKWTLYNASSTSEEDRGSNIHLYRFLMILKSLEKRPSLKDRVSLALQKICSDLFDADFVPRSKAKPSQLDAIQFTNKSLKEFTEYIHAVAGALEDGSVKEDEWTRIEKEFLEAQQHMSILKEKVDRMRQSAPKMKIVGES